jgi:hypothetical protein
MSKMKKLIFFILTGFIFFSCSTKAQFRVLAPHAVDEIKKNREIIIDMVLIYGGGAHRNVNWNVDHFTPYVSYTDRSGKESWLFDGFLMLEIVDGKGKIFATGYYGTPATKNEWIALADYIFKPGQSVDALDKCIAGKIPVLGKPPYKRKVVVALPEPIVAGPDSNYKETPADYWGAVDDKPLNFTIPEDRITACKWFIDYVLAKFEEGKYNHLELAGFYWIAEESLHTKTILTTVGKYIDDIGYTFNWIPYWKEKPDYFNWKELGFHTAYLQPNYFFNEQIPYSRLDQACKTAKEYNLDLELEFDTRVFSNNGNRGSRLYDYMNAFRLNGVLPIKRIAYYQECDALYKLFHASENKEKELFHDFCTFVLEHQEVYMKNLK